MSQWPTSVDGDASRFADLESAILQAGNYVCPSSDLRPRTLQSAREKVADRRSLRRVRTVLLVMVLMIAIVAPAADRWEWLQGPVAGPSHKEIHAAAIELASKSGMSSEWAFSETFSQWRRSLAMRFDHRQNNLR